MKKILIIPDAHVPFHSKQALAVVNKVAAGWKPDVCVILGDWIDCLSVSSHSRNPKLRSINLQHEVEVAQAELARLTKSLPKDCAKHFISGNHEVRLSRFVADRCPDLHGLLQMEGLLGLEKLGWSHTPYKQSLQIGKVSYTHDLGRSGRTAAFTAAQTYGGNAVIGHCHSATIAYGGGVGGEAHVGMCPGWLGDAEAIDYWHKDLARSQWQLGFGIGYMLPDGVTHLSLVPIIKGKCFVEGKLYR